jgi:hypothetical protein
MFKDAIDVFTRNAGKPLYELLHRRSAFEICK